jgi:hypothetical protein
MSRFDARIFRSKRRIAGVTAFVAAGTAAVVAAPALAGGSGFAAAQLIAHDAPAHQNSYQADPNGIGSDVMYVPTAPKPAPTAIAKPAPKAPTSNAAERASRSTARKSLTTSPSVSGGSPKAIAQSQLAARGWSGQFSCLNSLWNKESGWKVSAYNPSGAYGIPQALPGSKMASAGSDWQTNPATQIKWGLNYISSTYGTPCAAWAHSQNVNWY